MNTIRRALGNSTLMMVSQLVTWTTSLTLTGVIGRTLGDRGFGDLYLAMSWTVIFSVLVGFGLDQQLTRTVARDRTVLGQYLLNSMALKTCLFVLAYLLITGIVYALGYPPETRKTTAIFSCLLLFQGLNSLLGASYQAFERVAYSTVGGTLEKVSIAVIGIYLLTHGYGVMALAVAYVAVAAGNTLWQMYFLRRLGPITPTINHRIWPQLLKGGVPFFWFWVLTTVYFRVDVILLSKLTNSEVVGWYGAAYKLFETLMFLPTILSLVIMYPILARLSAQSRDGLRFAMDKGLSVLLMLGTPICVGLFTLAGPIITLIYGDKDFAPAVPALQWLAVALFLLYVNHMMVVSLWSLNQETKMIPAAGVAVFINIGVNFVLIPRYAHLGAAASTVVTELFLTAYVLAVIPKDLLSRNSLAVLGKALVASAVMALILAGLRDHSLTILIPVGGLAYCLCGLLLQLVPDEDLRMITAVFRMRRRSPVASVQSTDA